MGISSLVKTSLSNFAQRTTIAGVNNAASARSWIRCVYWMVICAGCLYYTAVGFASVVKDYMNYPYDTGVDIKRETSLEFPAVTVCNHNRVHCLNLMSEKFNLLDGPDRNSSETQKTLNILDDLIFMSGCDIQVCTALNEKVVDQSNATDDEGLSSADRLVLLQSTLLCEPCPENQGRSCSYLTAMRERASSNASIISAEDKKKINDGLEYFDCANYYTNSTSAAAVKSRKKREAESSYPSPSNDEPEVNRDCDATARFLQKYLMLDPQMRRNIGHRYETVSNLLGETRGFLSSCTYRGTDCSDSKFWLQLNNPSYGNCYLFNYLYNEEDDYVPRMASLTGLYNGLTVELFLDQANYMLMKLSKKAGARIVVHSPSQPPLPDEYGLDLAPNTAGSIAIEQNRVKRLREPFEAQCVSHWNETGYNITTDQQYSMSSCQRYCLQRSIIEECNCFHPDLVQDKIDNTMNGSACYIASNYSNPDYKCFIGLMDDFDKQRRTCSCHTDCNETEYTRSLSVTTWPSNQYWVELAFALGYNGSTVLANDAKSDEIKKTIQQNLVQANVYYETLNVRSVTQTAKYSSDTFVASLGGALGLYMGMAVIMLFELVELVFDIGYNIWKHQGSKRSKKDIGKNDI